MFASQKPASRVHDPCTCERAARLLHCVPVRLDELPSQFFARRIAHHAVSKFSPSWERTSGEMRNRASVAAFLVTELRQREEIHVVFSATSGSSTHPSPVVELLIAVQRRQPKRAPGQFLIDRRGIIESFVCDLARQRQRLGIAGIVSSALSNRERSDFCSSLSPGFGSHPTFLTIRFRYWRSQPRRCPDRCH